MRFPRQARIFRGHLDPAPIAGVAFLLVIFMQLGSILPTPGVMIDLRDSKVVENPAVTIRVAATGEVQFGTNRFGATNLASLREVLKASNAGPLLGLAVEPGAPAKLVADLHDLFGLQLAEGPAGLIGTSNPRVVVAVNFLGQYFYDNRRIGEEELKKELKRCLRDAARESKELDLLVWADKDVDFNAVSRLERLADEVGIKRAWQVERSQSSAAVSAKPTP